MLKQLAVLYPKELMEPRKLEVPMIDTVQNLVRSLYSCEMRVVPSRGKDHIRGKRGGHVAGTSVHLNPAYLAAFLGCLTLCLISMVPSANATIRNVQTYGAKGDGTTNDIAAINSAISALQPGDTLLFPSKANSTYVITAQLTISQTSGGVPLSNVTLDGSSCAIIRGTASGTGLIVIGGSGNGNPSYGPAVPLYAPANELAASFTTASLLGVTAGDYVRLQQGGKDYSTDTAPGHDTGCDMTGCRGEVVKVASVSGNTITVTTALHDSYDPAVNGAVAQKILNPLTGITVQNITFDGNGTNTYGLE